MSTTKSSIPTTFINLPPNTAINAGKLATTSDAKHGFKTDDLAVDAWGNKVRVVRVDGAALYPVVTELLDGAMRGMTASYMPSELTLLAPGDEGRIANKQHHHDWKKYVGFTDTYDYCTVCDEKRRG